MLRRVTESDHGKNACRVRVDSLAIFTLWLSASVQQTVNSYFILIYLSEKSCGL